MNGTVALAALLLGAVLVAVECNRPGWILPGATGLFLTLLGLWPLLKFFGWLSAAPWLGLGGFGFLALLRWRWFYGVPGAIGTTLLATSLALAARGSRGELDGRAALLAGSMLGVMLTALLGVAGRARRAKTNGGSAPPESRRHRALERWE